MFRIVQTFNDHNINDGTSYAAVLVNEYDLPGAQNSFLAKANADADMTEVYTVDTGTVALEITIRDYTNWRTLLAQLQGWFKRGTIGDLVITFLDTDDDYLKTCQVANLVQDPDNNMKYIISLNTGFTSWRAVTPDTYNWSLTGTGGTHILDNQGDDETALSVTFTLTTQPTNGYLKQQLYKLIPPAGVPALGTAPWCITLDTAALIADNSNKCQLNGSIANSDTTIAYDTVTGSIPTAGMGYLGTEQIKWTGKTGTTSGNLTGVMRGFGGTAAASHADNTELKVSHLQAGGNDLRVFVDEVETRRWLAGMNTSSTNIWFNIVQPRGYKLFLLTAIITTADIPTIEFAHTPSTQASIIALPNEGILIHGTEWIKYKKIGQTYKLGIIARGLLGSTRQTHTANSQFDFMPHVVKIVYGNSSSVDPSTLDDSYDDVKPCFSLSSSTNASWVVTSSDLFRDEDKPNRPGRWTPFGARQLFRYYTVDPDLAGAVMGMFISSYQATYGYVGGNAACGFDFYRGCGIDTVTMTGRKYRGDVAWPVNTGLRASVDGANYVWLWQEASPSSQDTFLSLATHSAISAGGKRWLRVISSGVTQALADSFSYFEIRTATINFVSANLPAGTLMTATDNGDLEFTLTNNANADAIAISLPMLLDVDLVLDGEQNTVLYDNLNAHDAMTLNDLARSVWVRLNKGDNELEIAAVDVGDLTAVLSWYKRRF